jgi:hypothetical protein
MWARTPARTSRQPNQKAKGWWKAMPSSFMQGPGAEKRAAS